jgi:hypothetical protein
MTDYTYGEALSDLRSLLSRWEHDEVRFAIAHRDVSIDVKDYLAAALSAKKGRSNKIAPLIVADLRTDMFAQKLVILAAIRHYVRVLERWNPPAALRPKYACFMTKAKRCSNAFAGMCKYEIVCGKCTNNNCPYSHEPDEARDSENANWLDNLPSQEEFYVAMTD